MPIKVRQANLDLEQEELLDILQRNLEEVSHARRFSWLYCNNPAGNAWSWFAYESETRKPVGVVSVFPRVMWLGEEIKLCGQVGDFAVDRNYRSLGPALMLQRATFELVDQEILALCYDCPPHDLGMSTFRRIGMEANCQMYRYARLLKTDRQLMKYLGQGRLAASIAALGNFLLDLWTSRRRKVTGLEISLHTDRFQDEFSLLDQQVGGSDTIRSRRTAEDLNWRYRENPLQEYQILTARQNGELVAFVIFSISDQDVYIMDLFGFMFPDAGLQLLEAIVEHLKKEPAQTLQAFISDKNNLSDVLQKVHFRYRSKEESVVAYATPGTEIYAWLDRRPNWSFVHADILA